PSKPTPATPATSPRNKTPRKDRSAKRKREPDIDVERGKGDGTRACASPVPFFGSRAWHFADPARHARRANRRSASSLSQTIPQRSARHRCACLEMADHSQSVHPAAPSRPIRGQVSTHLGPADRFTALALDETPNRTRRAVLSGSAGALRH